MNKFGGKWGWYKTPRKMPRKHLILQTESLELMATARLSRKRGKRPNAREYCGDIKDPQGFEVRSVDDYIGEGEFTTQTFCRGDFLLEYKGDLINYDEAQRREKEYAEADLGSFLYKGKHLCVDGTEDIFYQGRMINDAPKGDKLQNCAMKIVVVDNKPHLCAFATRDIVIGEELRFDYEVPGLPWRRETIQKATARRRNQSPDSLLGQKNGNIRDENVNNEKIPENPYIGDRNADSGITDTTESSFRDTNTADLREKEDSSDRHTENGGGRITENADPASMGTYVENIKTNGTISDRNADSADCTFEKGVTDTTESIFRDTNTTDLREKEYSSDRHTENGGGRITENADPASMDTDVEYIKTNGDISDRHTENGGGRITENADPASMDTDVENITTNGDISDRNADSADCTFEKGVTDTTESSFRDTNTADLLEKEYSSDRYINNGEDTFEGRGTDPVPMDTDVKNAIMIGDSSDRHTDNGESTFEGKAIDPVSLDTEVENVKINGDSEYGGNKWPAHVCKRKIVAGEFTVNYDSSSEDFDDDFRDPSYQQPDSDSGCSTSGDSDDHTDVCDDSDDIALLYKEGMVNSGSISNQDTVTERMTSADHHNGKQYCNDRRNDNGNTGEDRINHRDERKQMENDHYLNVHVNEEEVRKIRLMEVGSSKRKTALMELENRGNFKYNVKVMTMENDMYGMKCRVTEDPAKSELA